MATDKQIEEWQRKWERKEPSTSDSDAWEAWQRAKEKDMPR